jgi:hypothetical protein
MDIGSNPFLVIPSLIPADGNLGKKDARHHTKKAIDVAQGLARSLFALRRSRLDAVSVKPARVSLWSALLAKLPRRQQAMPAEAATRANRLPISDHPERDDEAEHERCGTDRDP